MKVLWCKLATVTISKSDSKIWMVSQLSSGLGSTQPFDIGANQMEALLHGASGLRTLPGGLSLNTFVRGSQCTNGKANHENYHPTRTESRRSRYRQATESGGGLACHLRSGRCRQTKSIRRLCRKLWKSSAPSSARFWENNK